MRYENATFTNPSKSAKILNESNIKKVISLFGNQNNTKKGRWGKSDVPPTLVTLTNLIDLTYNYTSDSKYHAEHFNDQINVRLNTPGFVAAHMFAEYLMHSKEISYKDALNLIDNGDISIDWYIGQSYANATWRQAAIYRDRAGEGDWLKSFNSIFDENGLTLAKDKVQIRMCAHLLIMHLNNSIPNIPDIDEQITPITRSENGDTRDTVERDFPPELITYVNELKAIIPKAGGKFTTTNGRVQLGGRNAVVYMGQRGGKYVKVGGSYVALSKAVKSAQEGGKKKGKKPAKKC